MSYNALYGPLNGILEDIDDTCEYVYDPAKFIAALKYSDISREISELEIRKDDVWLIAYPRCGQTWCQEIIWLLENNLNFEMASSTSQHLRAPKIELSAYLQEPLGNDSVTYFKNMSSPRCVKSNLPYSLLPKQLKAVKPKIIYIIRNPKDLWCIYHRYLATFSNFNGSVDELADLFCEGRVPLGCVLDHCLPFWHRRNRSNMLLLSYEDMRLNLKNTIRLLASFLEKSLTPEQIDQIYKFIGMDKVGNTPKLDLGWRQHTIKGRQSTYDISGEGLVGGWRTEMSPRTSKVFDDWIRRKTEGTGLTFNFG